MAVWLANDALDFRGDEAVAAGWLQRARGLLDGRPSCSELGFLLVLEGYYALEAEADPDVAGARAREAAALGRELGVADLEALGLALEGEALVVAGRVPEGMRRLDQASAVAAGEDFELPVSPAFALCLLISACERVGDFARVAQWCEAMQAQGERLNGRHVIGVCRSAYGHVLAHRGDWPAAETELLAAVGDLEELRPGLAPWALARLGALRARQGRSAEARALFERARPYGQGLLGLGALDLDAGDAHGAADVAERVLRRLGAAPLLERVPALELLALARARTRELGPAQAASSELSGLAAELGTPYLRGRARLVAGELAAAEGEDDDARRAYEDAIDLFAECAAPYEAALGRLALAGALAALGRQDAAAAEARAARDAFAALGAAPDVARAETLLGETGAPPPVGELTARELDVLRLVAEGLTNAEIARRLVLSEHTVHRHVANVRAKLRLPSRAAAVAYAAREGLL